MNRDCSNSSHHVPFCSTCFMCCTCNPRHDAEQCAANQEPTRMQQEALDHLLMVHKYHGGSHYIYRQNGLIACSYTSRSDLDCFIHGLIEAIPALENRRLLAEQGELS